jgi:hypothetical protein
MSDPEYPYLAAELDALRKRVKELEAVLEHDRTAICDGVNKLKSEIRSRSWLTGGRGSYAWDDDRYRQEFLAAGEAILRALAPLEKIAYELSNCPKTQAEVIAARKGKA